MLQPRGPWLIHHFCRLYSPGYLLPSPHSVQVRIIHNANMSWSGKLQLSTSGSLECALRGTLLLNHSFFNKGSAFTKEERRDFGLSGLLPQGIQTLEQQVQRAYQQYKSRSDDLAKNTFLSSLKEQNEVLFFRVSRC